MCTVQYCQEGGTVHRDHRRTPQPEPGMARPGFYTCGVIFTTSTCSDLQYSTRIYIACTCLRNVRVQTRFQFHAPGCFFFFPCTVL